jgi:hypothetical protein
MLSLLVIAAALIALDVAALLWGVDSREGVNDPEWERRQRWPGFGGQQCPSATPPQSSERRARLHVVK